MRGKEERMSKQISDTPVRPDEPISSSTTGGIPVVPKKQRAVFWPWLGGLLVVGLVIVGVVTLSVWNWLNNLQHGIGANQPSSAISTMNVGRSALYADLNITLTDVQYTTFFSNDPIHAGAATVRATVNVKNPTSSTVVIPYYDVARLLVPGHDPIAPTNLNLSAAPQAGANQTGWIDFPVAQNTPLDKLKLQLGNAATHEMLVTIPTTGKYDSHQNDSHTYHPSLTVYYYFKGWQIPGYTINYHLTSVVVSDSYNGTETKTGQQFYTLNFSVDNPNGVTVSPGLGYDYLRLSLSGNNHYPMDNTLPKDFKANAHGVTGHVTYPAPAGMHSLTIVFLRQAVQGGDPYTVSL